MRRDNKERLAEMMELLNDAVRRAPDDCDFADKMVCLVGRASQLAVHSGMTPERFVELCYDTIVFMQKRHAS